jgi:aspartate aminotransferase
MLVPPHDIISLARGEPDFSTPLPLVDSVTQALNSGWTHYGDFDGDPELRDAIAQRITMSSGSACNANEIVVTHGSTAALAAAVLAIVDPGDRVVLPEPTYSLYADLVGLAGGVPVPVANRPDHHWDLAALKHALPGARLFVFCNPCNPTGVVFNQAELAGLADLLGGSDTLVMADEAYDELVFDDAKFTSSLAIPGLKRRLIYVQTFSKTYAMTGWRVGYAVAPRAIRDGIARVHRTFNGPINAAVQRAALTALRDDGQLKKPMFASFIRRRALMVSLLKQIPGLEFVPPKGTFYVFARYALPIASAKLAEFLQAGGVLVRAGSEFGASGEGHLRLSFAVDEGKINEGVRRMAAVFATLRSG